MTAGWFRIERRVLPWVVVSCVLAGVWLAPAVAAPPEQVEVIYMVAYAHNEDSDTDERLEPMKKSLDTLEFTGFDHLSSGRWSMANGDAKTVELEEGYKLQIKMVAIGAEEASVKITIIKPDKSDPAVVTLSIRRNAAMMFGGTSFKKGKLVVPIRVRYPE